MAGENFFPLEVASVSYDLQLLDASGFTSLLRHIEELSPIVPDVGHLMGHN